MVMLPRNGKAFICFAPGSDVVFCISLAYTCLGPNIPYCLDIESPIYPSLQCQILYRSHYRLINGTLTAQQVTIQFLALDVNSHLRPSPVLYPSVRPVALTCSASEPVRSGVTRSSDPLTAHLSASATPAPRRLPLSVWRGVCLFS